MHVQPKDRSTFRFIDLGEVSAVRSQSIYHGLAYARRPETPDTIVVLVPGEPYVCIGYHQGLEQEVDVQYCRENGIPILRREVGGGAVYLDENQLFIQWVMGPRSLPSDMKKRFQRFTEPLVQTYRGLGIPAHFHPVNDIHVSGKKITGTGAARIGNAEVLVGNFLVDFNHRVMARILNVPSAEFRAHVHQGLLSYLTTIQGELGKTPDRDELRDLYRESCEECLGVRLQPGTITDREWQTIEEVDRRFLSDAFRNQDGGLKRHGVKIHEDVWVRESSHVADGIEIRATGTVRKNHLDALTLSCSPSPKSPSILTDLASALLGTELDSDTMGRRIETFFQQNEVMIPGFPAPAWVETVLGLNEKRRRESHV